MEVTYGGKSSSGFGKATFVGSAGVSTSGDEILGPLERLGQSLAFLTRNCGFELDEIILLLAEEKNDVRHWLKGFMHSI